MFPNSSKRQDVDSTDIGCHRFCYSTNLPNVVRYHDQSLGNTSILAYKHYSSHHERGDRSAAEPHVVNPSKRGLLVVAKKVYSRFRTVSPTYHIMVVADAYPVSQLFVSLFLGWILLICVRSASESHLGFRSQGIIGIVQCHQVKCALTSDRSQASSVLPFSLPAPVSSAARYGLGRSEAREFVKQLAETVYERSDVSTFFVYLAGMLP